MQTPSKNCSEKIHCDDWSKLQFDGNFEINFLRMSKRRKLYDNECIEWINSDSNLKQLFSFYESSDSIYVVLDVVACDRILFNCMYGMVDEMSNGKKVQMFLLSLVVSFSKMGILNHNLNSLGGMKFVSVSKNIKFIDAFASMTHMIEEMLMKFLSRDNEIICRKMNLQHSGVRLDYDNFKKGIFFQCKQQLAATTSPLSQRDLKKLYLGSSSISFLSFMEALAVENIIDSGVILTNGGISSGMKTVSNVIHFGGVEFLNCFRHLGRRENDSWRDLVRNAIEFNPLPISTVRPVTPPFRGQSDEKKVSPAEMIAAAARSSPSYNKLKNKLNNKSVDKDFVAKTLAPQLESIVIVQDTVCQKMIDDSSNQNE